MARNIRIMARMCSKNHMCKPEDFGSDLDEADRIDSCDTPGLKAI